MDYKKRIEIIRENLVKENIEAFVSFSDVNYFYLTGFDGSSGCVIITKDDALVMTDSRYITQSKEQTATSGVELIIHRKTLLVEVKEVLEKLGVKKIGFEAGRLFVAQLQALESSAYQLVGLTNFVETIREKKDATEVAAIKVAIDVIEQVYKEMLTYAKAGMSEVDLAMRMEMHMRQLGASGPSFDTIIASGVRGALPHGQASSKILEIGDLVTVDFGAKVNNYCSDMTRTFAIGTPKSEKMVEIYNTVLKAQLAGTAAIAPGKTGKEVDAAARNIITDAGYGQYFGHSLGHSVGIEVHELPSLAPTSERLLEAGMIVTTEPGIYIEDLGGVRIEDMVLVTKDGHENLMTLPKELIIV